MSRAKPMTAMAELIWNALDADALEVRVEFKENELGGTDSVQVSDNGGGLGYDRALVVFESLGGSWKLEGGKTARRNRVLHGRYGKGRFRAFALGNHVQWKTVCKDDGENERFSITGRGTAIGEFDVSDPVDGGQDAAGMVVDIADLPPNTGLLRGVKAVQEITDILALYMRQYPDVRVVYDGIPIDPANAQKRATDYTLEELVMENGERVLAEMTVVEWTMTGKRGIVLCDPNGFAVWTTKTRLLFRGFSYTAYLKSSHITTLENEGLLQLEDMAADVKQILDAARTQLRQHFAIREVEEAQDTLAQWKSIGLYPYENEPANVDQETERRIFDIYATHLSQFSDFFDSSPKNKRLMLRLLQELVRSEPTRVARVLDDLISFPEEKEDEVSELLMAEGSQT